MIIMQNNAALIKTQAAKVKAAAQTCPGTGMTPKKIVSPLPLIRIIKLHADAVLFTVTLCHLQRINLRVIFVIHTV